MGAVLDEIMGAVLDKIVEAVSGTIMLAKPMKMAIRLKTVNISIGCARGIAHFCMILLFFYVFPTQELYVVCMTQRAAHLACNPVQLFLPSAVVVWGGNAIATAGQAAVCPGTVSPPLPHLQGICALTQSCPHQHTA